MKKINAHDLLLEIGTEEIPPSFLSTASELLKTIFCEFLKQNKISYSKAINFYTPRRLTLIVNDVSEKQKEEIVEIQGPPKKYAFDELNNPTQVALGFVKSHKLKVNDLYVKETPKGEYVFVKKKTQAKSIKQLLKENLYNIITSIQFPKTMRWQGNKLRFARPIRWICLVYGNKPINVKIDGIKSTGYTYGHRNAHKNRIKVTNIKKYQALLKKSQVIVLPNERKELIKRQMVQLAKKIKGVPIIDEELLDEITNICEMPLAILCRFKPEFLNLPAPVLITTLKTHTRSFAVQSQESQKLLPYFISVVNTPTCNCNQVRYWYERAVESRLDDAQFYFNEDVKVGLEKRVEDEKKVIWIENLGTLFEKTARLEKLVLVIAQRVPSVNLNSLLKAAYLCKSDLLTNMVREKEYTSLQGIMGGIYAKLSGESDLVAQIISEHYLPKGINDNLPQTIEGSILSIADKIDNIVGAFIIGEIPSGSLDPFGLRRQALAIGSICLNKQLNFDLSEIISLNLEYFNKQNETHLLSALSDFFKERINTLLLDQNYRYDIINAVLALKSLNIFDIYLRVKALTEFRKQREFEPLVIGQKRVNNIIRDLTQSYILSKDLLTTPAEQQVYQSAKAIEENLLSAISAQDYLTALNLLLSLRPAIDNLFDQVLIMCEDEKMRNNRIALLQYINSLFIKVANLSEIVIE